MMQSRTINVSVKRDPKTVYGFVSNLENLSKWASSTFSSIKKVDGEWLVDIAQGGQNKVMLIEKNNFGVLDHGYEIMLTVFQIPEMIDEVFAEDIKKVENDLNHLKNIIKKS